MVFLPGMPAYRVYMPAYRFCSHPIEAYRI